jgi:ribosomal protein L11 methylase PrmA
MNSGLYETLIAEQLMIPHNERELFPESPCNAYKVLEPELISFISYPYEWCFSQLKDAALLTLKILRKSLQHGMILKDASAFNIQFQSGRPIFIDTLSFEQYQHRRPWVAYRQFCQHFLAPLSLMRYVNIGINQFLRVYIDGFPLDLTSTWLPLISKFKMGTLFHIHLHAMMQRRYAYKPIADSHQQMRQNSLYGLIDHLEQTIKKMDVILPKTEWSHYYDQTNYDEKAFEEKKIIVKRIAEEYSPRVVWDLGGNVGVFSRLLSHSGIDVMCFDLDPVAVELNYRQVKKNSEEHMLPLIINLSNPSPSLGWHHRERMSLVERGPADMVLALALIHHLCITNTVPIEHLAKCLKDLAKILVIEFVPKEDSQVQRLLASRADIFEDYGIEKFEEAFGRYFQILEKTPLKSSRRIIYVMEKR